MELASFLAGQRWSDHPACTHPLLAALARQVNDRTGDAGRQRLAGLIPSVIGLTSDDPRLDVLIAGRCARTALPVVCAERQRVMAVAILTGERVLAGLDGRPAGSLSAGSLSVGSRQALDRAPAAARWARQFIGEVGPSAAAFRRHAAPSIVRCAVEGIAQACIPDPEQLLHDLLADTIDECAAFLHPTQPATTPNRHPAAVMPASSRPG